MFTAFGFKNRTKRRIFSKAMGRVPRRVASKQQLREESSRAICMSPVPSGIPGTGWGSWHPAPIYFMMSLKLLEGSPSGQCFITVFLWPCRRLDAGHQKVKDQSTTVTALSLAWWFWALQQFYFGKQPQKRKRLCPPGLSFVPWVQIIIGKQVTSHQGSHSQG